ncbi:MAG: helix-hairpin-helix domain-containing protein [Salinirussus sp.]
MPRDIAPLTRALDAATRGSQADVYQLLAAWNASIEATLEIGPGRTESVMRQYYEEVLSLTDAAATRDGIDWEFLGECREAYPAGVGDHACTALLVNVISRCVIRTRIEEGVGAIPAWALGYLVTVARDDEGPGNELESSTFGWGIGHPESAVAERTVNRAASGAHEWAAAVLAHATVAAPDAGLALFEQLVRATEGDTPLHFLASLEGLHERSILRLPEYWDPADEYTPAFELSDAQRERVLTLIGDAVPVATLRGADTEFDFDLQRVAEDMFRRKLPESVPDGMLHIGKYRGGKWHVLGESGCPDGDPEQVDTREPFFECRYRIDDPMLGERVGLDRQDRRGPEMCRRCADTVVGWDNSRYDYVVARDRRFDGGTLVTWTPLTEDRWVRACDVCGKPAGASHTESRFDQAACPSCLRELSNPQGILSPETETGREGDLTLAEILSGDIETRTLPPRDTLEERARDQRRQHNRKRAHLPLTHVGLSDTKVETLAAHGYETVGDISEADPEILSDIGGLGRRWQPEHLPHTYTLSLSAFDGIGETLAARLDEHGYGTVPALEAASTDELARIRGMSDSKADRILNTVDSWSSEKDASAINP